MGTELKLIGLAGLAMSGKDTAADVLVENYGFKKLSMAYPLRLEADLAVWTRAQPTQCSVPENISRIISEGAIDVWAKPTSNDARALLQWWGTEYRREKFKDSYWVDLLKQRIYGLLNAGTPVVISDIRFANEARMIQELNGHIWKIERQSNTGVGKSHASEQFVDSDWPWTVVLGNNGTTEQFQHSVKDLYQCYMQIARCYDEIMENPDCSINILRLGGWADWHTEKSIIVEQSLVGSTE